MTLLSPSLTRAQDETCLVPPSRFHDADVHDAEATWAQVRPIPSGNRRARGPRARAVLHDRPGMLGDPRRACTSLAGAAVVQRPFGTGCAVRSEIAWLDRCVGSIDLARLGFPEAGCAEPDIVVATGDVPTAVRPAFPAGWDRWAAAPRGARTNPPRAFLEVDGVPRGQASIRRATRAGMHRLRLTREEHRPVVRGVRADSHGGRAFAMVEVGGTSGPEANRPETIDGAARRDRAADGNGEPPRPASEHDDLLPDVLVGGLLIAAGVAALVPPFVTIAEHGRVIDHDERPDEYVQFGPASGVLLGSGAAAVIGGVVLMWVRPFATRARLGPTEASLTFAGEF